MRLFLKQKRNIFLVTHHRQEEREELSEQKTMICDDKLLSCGISPGLRLVSSSRRTRSNSVILSILFFVIPFVIFPSSRAQNEVHSVDVFPRENAKAHRTSAYEIVHNPNNPALVLRRGDPFYLALQMRRPYDPARDKIRLEFMYGECSDKRETRLSCFSLQVCF